MSAETEKNEESPIDPRDLLMDGKVIRFIKTKVGFKWADLAREAAEFRAVKGGFLRTSASGIKDYMAQTRQIKTVYATITERLVGKEEFNKWLAVIYRDRPKWFSEPSAKQK